MHRQHLRRRIAQQYPEVTPVRRIAGERDDLRLLLPQAHVVQELVDARTRITPVGGPSLSHRSDRSDRSDRSNRSNRSCRSNRSNRSVVRH
jgi:hypothetical protein